MELNHREKIQKNIPKLMKILNYKSFVQLCLDKNIITETMKQIIENKLHDEARMQALLEKICQRGPNAYMKLINILFDINSNMIDIMEDFVNFI